MASRKGRKLPFVVQPRYTPIVEQIGSEESGLIEIERRGYLSVSEKAFVQGSESGDNTTSLVHSLAIRIGGELNTDPVEILERISTGRMEGDLAPYAEEVMGVIAQMTTFNEKHQIIVATCMMIHRIDPKWEIEDTFELHPDIIDGLNQLYTDEEKKSLDALAAAMDSEKEEIREAMPGKD